MDNKVKTLPIKVTDERYIFSTCDNQFITHTEDDISFLLWSGQYREAERGSGRTLSALHRLRKRAKYFDTSIFVSATINQSKRAKSFFASTFSQDVIHIANRSLFITDEENVCKVIFVSIMQLRGVIRGLKNFDIIHDHNWNEGGRLSKTVFSYNSEIRKEAHLRSFMAYKRES